jgi:hypothetical protein
VIRRFLTAVAVWIAVLVGLVLLLTFVPAANSLPNWVYIATLLALLTGFAVISRRKRMQP